MTSVVPPKHPQGYPEPGSLYQLVFSPETTIWHNGRKSIRLSLLKKDYLGLYGSTVSVRVHAGDIVMVAVPDFVIRPGYVILLWEEKLLWTEIEVFSKFFKPIGTTTTNKEKEEQQ